MDRSTLSRILVVDDNRELCAVLRELLARHGYEVDVAGNGAEAMATLTAPGGLLPELVILDITMPLEGGVEVLRFIRTGLRKRLPVIVLTASATPEQEQEMGELGIEAYLRKPTSSEVIVSTVRGVLGRG